MKFIKKKNIPFFQFIRNPFGFFLILLVTFTFLFLIKCAVPNKFEPVTVVILTAAFIYFCIKLGIKQFDIPIAKFLRIKINMVFQFIGTLVLSWFIITILFRQSSYIIDIGTYLFLSFLNAAIIATMEEFIFRYSIISEALIKNMHVVKSIILSAILFSAFHVFRVEYNLMSVYLIYTFLVGLTLGIIYYATQNILIPIAMHTALNFTDSILKETSGPDYLTNENSLIILGLVLFVINLIIYQKEIRGNINITI